MTKIRSMMTVLAGFLLLLLSIAWSAEATGGDKASKFASERSQHRFLGATQVVLAHFNPSAKEMKTTLQLDRNDVSFSPFGDPQLTVVLYKPFEVKVTRLDMADPMGKNRSIFSVELPKEQSEALGKKALRLVWPVGEKAQPPGVRLLLLDPMGKVIQTRELHPVIEGI